ncbi:DNA-binding transcriptional LysR family regulator [Paraburkholderia atlantica]
MHRKFDDLLLGSIELFCLAAELGSFTLAANAASVTPAAVSRSVARLEERLGVRLFVRTTRQIRLTDAGRRYFEQCRQALSQLMDAEREVTGEQTTPAGVVRISMPTPYGHYRVLPLLPAFRERYPQVRVETHLSNRNIDFADEGFDLAIRGRAPADSNLVARKLEDAEMVVVATPAYLKRAGVPKTIEDLQAHECIQFEMPSSGRHLAWTFEGSPENADVLTRGSYGTSGDALAGVTLARAGRGSLSDVSLRRGGRPARRSARGSVARGGRAHAAIHPALSARALSDFARAGFRRISDRAVGQTHDTASARAAHARALSGARVFGWLAQCPALWPPSTCRISPVTNGAESR